MNYTLYPKLSVLKGAAQPRCSYSFDQAQDWYIWWYGGACDGVSLDWLRRKFLGKRLFGDNKYATSTILWNKASRQALGQKHILMSKLFRREWEAAYTQANPMTRTMTPEPWSALAYANFVRAFHEDEGRVARKAAKDEPADTSGFERLSLECKGMISGQTEKTGRLEVLEEVFKLGEAAKATSWGILFKLHPQQADSGHAVALHVDGTRGTYDFFDPNVGEYSFADKESVVTFFVAIWALKYGTYDTLIPCLVTLRNG